MAGSGRRAYTPISVIGVGGAGGGVIDRAKPAAAPGVVHLAVDTDLQALARRDADVKVDIGRQLARGLGTSGDWTKGRAAAEENRAELTELVKDADMVFITAGMGGGTGTGASGVLAEVARAGGALTIGVVTRPFRFEGRVRNETAETGIKHLREKVDALVVVPNDRLSQVVERKTTLEEAFRIAGDVLRQGVQDIADLIVRPGVVDVDFADVKATMTDTGEALMGVGFGSGDNRSEDAARQALASPLLEASIDGAQRILCSITAGQDLTPHECERVATIVRTAVEPNATVVIGSALDARMRGELRVTIFATGIGRRLPPGQEPPWPSGVPSWPRPRTGGEGAMAWPWPGRRSHE